MNVGHRGTNLMAPWCLDRRGSFVFCQWSLMLEIQKPGLTMNGGMGAGSERDDSSFIGLGEIE